MENFISTFNYIAATLGLLPKSVKVLGVVFLIWVLARLAKRLVPWALRNLEFSDSDIKLARLWTHTTVWATGIVIGLYIYGINPLALFGSLGGTMILVGFVFKPTLSNVGAGIRLRYFKNDFVKGSNFHKGANKGTVKTFGLTHFYIEREDGYTVAINYSSLSGDYAFITKTN